MVGVNRLKERLHPLLLRTRQHHRGADLRCSKRGVVDEGEPVEKRLRFERRGGLLNRLDRRGVHFHLCAVLRCCARDLDTRCIVKREEAGRFLLRELLALAAAAALHDLERLVDRNR